MQNIWLMRHGRAISNHPDGDAARRLSEDGIAGVANIAKTLRRLPFRAEEFWASPYTRAQMTADVIQPVVGGIRKQAAGFTPDGDPHAAAAELMAADKDIWVVSHLPFLPALIQALGRNNVNVNIEPGTITHLARVGNNVVLCGIYPASVLERLAEASSVG